MAWARHDYDDIPGTYVFDGKTSLKGYPLNKMCMSFNRAENREAFQQDEEAYCRKYGLSEEQIEAVIKRDWLRMVQLGGNFYYLAKLAVPLGCSVQDASAQMRGMTVEEYKQMLSDGGGKDG